MKYRLGILVLALCATACKAEYRDLSADQKYQQLIGQTVRLQDEFIVHAVTLPGSPIHTIDQYNITPKPGFGGRYVPFRKPLPAGTQLHILKVEECTNCLAFNDLRFLVQPPESQYSDHDIYLDADFGDEHLVVEEGGRAVFRSRLIEVLAK